MNKKLNDLVILVKGAGEMATGVAHRLASCHLKVCMTETAEPQAVRREVAFSEAVFDQEKLGDIDPRGIAEMISEFAAPMGEEFNSMKDAEILNLIKRRPCTAEDISKALGLHLGEVAKYSEKFVKEGVVHYRMHEHHCYYESALTH